jgi:hypothetical protein
MATALGAAVRDAVRIWLADGGSTPSDVDPTTGKGPEWGKAAPIGLLVIVLLGVVCYFLARSMSRNIKKVPASFEPLAEQSVPATADQPAESPPTPDGREPPAPRSPSRRPKGTGGG